MSEFEIGLELSFELFLCLFTTIVSEFSAVPTSQEKLNK